jgi:quercetin dioxygenase-like cupin family protein
MSEGLHVVDLLEDQNVTAMATASPLVFLGNKNEGPRPAVQWIHMTAGQTAPEHAHRGWSCTVVIEGSMIIGGKEYGEGKAILVEADVDYGPFAGGPEGATILEVFDSQRAITPIWDEADPRVEAQYASMGHRHPL